MTRPLIPVGIVAHHSRHERAARMAEALDAEVIAVDTGGVGAGRNHEHCYEWLAESTAPWVVLLEDDAIPVKNFRDQLHAVLRAAPATGLISLYLGRSRPPHWQPSIAQVIASDQHFLMASELLHHVAVAIKPALIPIMLRFIRNETPYGDGKLPIDEAVGRWARAASMPVAYSHPSIVDHDARLGTLIASHVSQHTTDNGQRPPHETRKAWAFGVRADWETTTATIPDPLNAYPAGA
jgi:hypothetical protein